MVNCDWSVSNCSVFRDNTQVNDTQLQEGNIFVLTSFTACLNRSRG